MTGYQVCSCGKADGRDERDVESAECRAKLLFEAKAQVGESAGESGGGVVIEEVVRRGEAKLGPLAIPNRTAVSGRS